MFEYMPFESTVWWSLLWHFHWNHGQLHKLLPPTSIPNCLPVSPSLLPLLFLQQLPFVPLMMSLQESLDEVTRGQQRPIVRQQQKEKAGFLLSSGRSESIWYLRVAVPANATPPWKAMQSGPLLGQGATQSNLFNDKIIQIWKSVFLGSRDWLIFH